MELLHRVEKFLKASGMPMSRLGREAIGDAHLVPDLRAGRECGTRTTARILAYLDREREAARG